jgi:hypothetical protein
MTDTFTAFASASLPATSLPATGPHAPVGRPIEFAAAAILAGIALIAGARRNRPRRG